jgi:ribosomal protein S17E
MENNGLENVKRSGRALRYKYLGFYPGDTEENHKIIPSVWSIDDRNINKNILSHSSVESKLLSPKHTCITVKYRSKYQ